MTTGDFFTAEPIEAPDAWARGFELLAFVDVLSGLPTLACPSRAESGRGRTVILLPGFATSPKAMSGVQRVASSLGFKVRDWGLGLNNGQVPTLLPAFADKLKQAAENEGPAILIGWSLGGYIAREVARDNPGLVAALITLGTPVWGGPKYTTVSRFYRGKDIDMDAIERETIERYKTPLTTPTTALYSRRDGIVAWRACIDHWSPNVTHVEVGTTHIGMPFSREVLHQVATHLRAL